MVKPDIKWLLSAIQRYDFRRETTLACDELGVKAGYWKLSTLKSPS
jgi:hypothetical protein